MSRTMALDVGEATVGVAISDPLGMTAQPLLTLRRIGIRKDLRAIVDLIARHEISAVVVGMPLRMSGEAGPAAESAAAFADRLGRSVRVPVVTWDERLTTVQAERVLVEADLSRSRRREVINQVAAAIILQSYLDASGKTRP